MTTIQFFSSHSYRAASAAERFAVCNGCGSARAKFDFVPDTIYGLDINEACNIHDWDYHEGQTAADKIRADARLLANLCLIIEARTKYFWLKILRWKRAVKYYVAVARHGGAAFWEGKSGDR